MNCPLCCSQSTGLLSDNSRTYFFCSECELLFVPPMYHLSVEEERARYELHTNTVSDTGYVNYLDCICKVVAALPITPSAVLDFGSGKNQVLEHLLRQKGINCISYDPLYEIGSESLSQTFNVVILSEVIEHLREIKNELSRIGCLIKPGGYCIVRTNLYFSIETFFSWWYRQDKTHIQFFNRTTINKVAVALHLPFSYSSGKDIFVFGPKATRNMS